jgi:hypothetical protein
MFLYPLFLHRMLLIALAFWCIGPAAQSQSLPIPGMPKVDYDTVSAPVVKVFSAEDKGARFIAYQVNWNGKEVIVTDPLGMSQHRVGDRIQFMVSRVALPQMAQTSPTVSLGFNLLDMIPDAHSQPGSSTGNSDEDMRQMKVASGDLSAATDELERFYALGSAARKAFKAGDLKKAEELAQELEKLTPKHPKDWNYGNAVQDSNQVLGRIALRNGDVAEAKKRLLASANSKGSPQMNSFGPNMILAKELLEKGEKETVIEYFDLCAKFWTMGQDKLKDWRASAQQGNIPAFGASLLYGE